MSETNRHHAILSKIYDKVRGVALANRPEELP
jgi:hypothetical protein